MIRLVESVLKDLYLLLEQGLVLGTGVVAPEMTLLLDDLLLEIVNMNFGLLLRLFLFFDKIFQLLDFAVLLHPREAPVLPSLLVKLGLNKSAIYHQLLQGIIFFLQLFYGSFLFLNQNHHFISVVLLIRLQVPELPLLLLNLVLLGLPRLHFWIFLHSI